jgi:hypothetical protein
LLKLPLETVVAALEVLELSLQLLVFGHQTFDVCVAGSSHGFLDILVDISWFFWLLIKSDKDLGKLVNDTGLLKVFSELFFFLFGCLN